ncbi:MAG: hypothetical protein KDK07_17240 [Bauldia sp.]|nr:hypothetical protein [Bauldia sp.]
MALPELKVFTGSPIDDPWNAFGRALDQGVATASNTQIVVETTDGYTVVFTGSFTVVGGDVVGGTMTGFTAFAGSTRVMKGDGYSVDGAALFDAIQGYNVDEDPFNDLVIDIPTKFVGSSKGDEYQTRVAGSKILGKAGHDILFAEFGEGTIIKGGNGNDIMATIEGGATFVGNKGNDSFMFLLDPLDPMTAFNRIKDFHAGEDVIGLALDSPLLLPGYLDKSQFHKGTEATKAGHLVIYDKGSGKIYLDADGNGAGAQFAFAKVDPGTKLGADDFFVQSLIAA